MPPVFSYILQHFSCVLWHSKAFQDCALPSAWVSGPCCLSFSQSGNDTNTFPFLFFLSLSPDDDDARKEKDEYVVDSTHMKSDRRGDGIRVAINRLTLKNPKKPLFFEVKTDTTLEVKLSSGFL
jgi:hypothetical protein